MGVNIPRLYLMKKILCSVLVSVFCCAAAFADVKYTETEVVTTWENVDIVVEAPTQSQRFYSSRDVARANSRPCAQNKAEPVRVKTHTEVIDHYQVYQPVTIYKPMGTQIERRVVPVKSCNKCF